MVGVVPSMVGVVPGMVGVVPSMVGVVPSMVGVVPSTVQNPWNQGTGQNQDTLYANDSGKESVRFSQRRVCCAG